MWTDENCPRYNRDKVRYPSDLTDEEWAHIEPLIPPGKPGDGKQRVDIREGVNGVMYLLSKPLFVNKTQRFRSIVFSIGARQRIKYLWARITPLAPHRPLA